MNIYNFPYKTISSIDSKNNVNANLRISTKHYTLYIANNNNYTRYILIFFIVEYENMMDIIVCTEQVVAIIYK